MDGTTAIIRRRVGALVVAAVAVVATACTSTPEPAASTASAAYTATYAEAPCPTPNIAGIPDFDFPANVRCGWLTVPENRAKPDGRTIRVFAARVPAVSPAPGAAPLVVLAGGPGGAGSFQLNSMVGFGINAGRDVVFVDQRGTNHADPRLGCPELDNYVNSAFGLPFSAPSTTVGDTAATKACRDRLAASGIDLAAYNTAENAADIADLRVATGIPSWDDYGVSYGTKLAQVLLRDHPQGIRAMVLDSVSPAENVIVENWWAAPASSFAGIFAACAAQATCVATYPNLESDFYTTVDRLTATPLVVATTDGAGAPLTLNIDGYQLVYAVINASEHTDGAAIPKLIADTARGDTTAITAAMIGEMTPLQIIGLGGYGLAFTVFCQESANLTTEAATLTRSRALLPKLPDQVLTLQPKQGRLFTECPVWDVGKAAASMDRPVVSDVPTLIMEGALDAATAPEWVELVRPGLSRSQYVEFPLTGHSVLGKTECSVTMLRSFLDDPTAQVDGACAAQTQLTFVT